MDRRRQLIEAILRPSAPKPGGPILDLSQVPSQDAQIGLLSGMLQNYQPGMSDYARDAEGVARSMATAAPEAIVKAYEDPNLATVSSAAGQTALTFGKPLQAAGIAGMGLLGSVLGDAGVFDTEAQAGKKGTVEPAPQIPGIAPEEQAVFDAAWKQMNAPIGSITKVARQSAKDTVDGFMTRMGAKSADAAAQKQKEYNDKVASALDVREKELAKQHTFSDTETGKWYKENATWLPFAAAYGGGFLSRLFTGPGKSATGKVFKDWALPIGSGAGLSFGAQNAPEIYDMKQAPSLNPEKEAYRKGALELPEGHQDKQKWEKYAAGLQDLNPVKKAASDALEANLGMTGLTAAAEGLSLGKFGAGTVNLPRRLINDVKANRSQTAAQAGQATSPAAPSPVQPQTAPATAGQNVQSYRTYGDLPQDLKQTARDAYVIDRALSGGSPVPKTAADGYRKVFSDNGINVPVTPARIKATNDAVGRFVQANGREPMGPADWSQIFNDKTLLVALGAGVGAGAMAGGSGEAEAADPQRAMLVDLIRRVQAGEI